MSPMTVLGKVPKHQGCMPWPSTVFRVWKCQDGATNYLTQVAGIPWDVAPGVPFPVRG